MLQIANYINGEFQPSHNNTYLDNYNPATGKVLNQFPHSDELDVVQAIQAAQKAFPSWSQSPIQKRANYLYKIAEAIEGLAEELAEQESLDVGKPLWLAKEVDIPRSADNFRFFAGRILHHEEKSTDMNGKALNYTLRQPLGVAGVISSWNLPLYLLTWKIAPAIACGNSTVCKPSEMTPMTAYLLSQIFEEVSLPQGVVNIVHGMGVPVGATLVSHPGVPLISFTGGTETGIKIQQLAAPHCKKISLELGGKNACLIFKDADLQKAVPGAIRSSFLNQGEICLCSERIYVQEDIYDEFMAEFKKQTQNIVVGDPKDSKTFMGPLISKEHLKKVKSYIELAKKDRGEVVTGQELMELKEKNRDGYFMRPTIITDLTDCSEVQYNEIFGPVVTVKPFKYAHEAIKWANTSHFGLSANIWTQNISRAHKTAAQLQVGTVWINTWLHRDLRVPFGGAKASGLGREGGDHSIDFYTEQKNICIQF